VSDPHGGVHGLIQGASERQGDDGIPPTKHKSKRGLIVAVVAVVVVVIIGIVAFLGAGLFAGTPDYKGAGKGSAIVVIKPGQSLTEIGQTLLTAGVVKSKQAFVDAAKANPDSTKVSPGTYRLARGMQASLALSALLDSSSRVTSVVLVPEGARNKQVVTVSSKGTGIPEAQFNAALAQPSTLGLPVWAHNNAEGFLFPATYTFDPGVTATQVLTKMTDRFSQSADDLNLVGDAARIHQTPYDVVIVASIIQREVAPRDYAKAARVIYNRLAQGMKLQLDSTVAYGLGIEKLQLTSAQLASNTPYNTYVHTGLPPTPISNPGDAALTGALHPATGNWVYFVTVNLDTQDTRFSSTYEQFLKDKQLFLDWVNKHS
jgi:UPF0755 protein